MTSYSRRIARFVRASGSSFYWAMRLLPRQRRQAMFAIYAFCRELDDIADGPAATAEKLSALNDWRDRLQAIRAGRAAGPLGLALHEAIECFHLDYREFDEIISGMEMDVRGEMRAPKADLLRLYCRRVAGAVGLLSVPVFGCDSPGSRAFALTLGEALQLTNILRDLDEDAGLGRLYVPHELLDEAGIAARDPLTVLNHPAFPSACERLAAWAEERFEAAGLAVSPADAGRLRPALIMMTIYRRLLDRLRRRGWRQRQPTRPGVGESLWVAFRHLAWQR